MDARHGRRTYLIDRKFQLRYTLMLAFAGAAISALFGGLLYAAQVQARHSVDTYRTLVPSSWLKLQLSQQETTTLWLVVGVTVMMAAALGLFGVLLTHRVAGPIYVMSRYMAVLGSGRFPAMRPLRKHDELKEFFERFHTAVETLRAREAEEAAKMGKVLRVLSPLATQADAKAALEELSALAVRKEQALAQPPP